MDDRRFDSLVKLLASGHNRRSVLSGIVALGGIAAATSLPRESDAARRPTPTPKPHTCPTGQHWDGHDCDCDSGAKCGPECCTGEGVCCDNACCYSTCYDEELCCSTGIPCGKKCCETGTRCVHGGCYDDPCKTIGEPCAANGDCCGFDIDAVCAYSESQHQSVCTYSS